MQDALQDVYHSYADLCAKHREGEDFDRIVRPRVHAQTVVVAPHGGRLENHTDTIAESLAGADFSLYCFRSKLGWGKTNLHITSHRFDDPECIALLGQHRWAVAVHGCGEAGEQVFIGGRDEELAEALAAALRHAGIAVQTSGHAYPGRHAMNICNRTASGRGVQIELTMPFRLSGALPGFVQAVRSVLLARQRAG